MTHVALMRLYTVLPLALLAYGIAAHAGAPRPRATLASAAIALAVAGGYAYNDLRDQARDRVNRPARPIVSGRLSERYVRRLVVSVFTGAVAVALVTRSSATIAFIVLLVVCSILYSDAIKHVAGLKNTFVGAWCGLLPWGASLDLVPWTTILPATVIVGLFVTQKELVADVFDLDGDAAAGVRTIPVLLGRRGGLTIVLALNVVSLLFVPPSVFLHLDDAARVIAAINALALCGVLLRLKTLRAYLELQKVVQIGGCIVLFALLLQK